MNNPDSMPIDPSMYKMRFPKGTVVHIKGIPVEASEELVVVTHPSNAKLINEELMKDTLPATGTTNGYVRTEPPNQ